MDNRGNSRANTCFKGPSQGPLLLDQTLRRFGVFVGDSG